MDAKLSDVICGLRAWRSAGETAANHGDDKALMQLDVMVQVALDELEAREYEKRGRSFDYIYGFERRPSTERLAWALGGISAHFGDDLLGDDLRIIHAELAEKSA